MIYVPGFIKIGSGVQKFMGGGVYTETQSESLLLFFQNKGSRPKKDEYIRSSIFHVRN
jgi:hypothetical protein